MVDRAKNHPEAQVPEHGTNSQYHPQNVRGLGEPPKFMADAPAAVSSSVHTIVDCKLSVCQKPAFPHKPFAFHALHHNGLADES
jgi:hypothetical protein